MKKIIAMLLCVIMLMSLCACGAKDAAGLLKNENTEEMVIGGADSKTSIFVASNNAPQAAPDAEPVPTEEPVETVKSSVTKEDGTERVVVYNADAGIADTLNALANAFQAETGIPVSIVTVSEDYDNSLSDALDGSDAPTMFTVNKYNIPKFLVSSLDLNGTEAASHSYANLLNWYDGDQLAALAYDYVSLGIGVNISALADNGFTPDNISGFQALKEITEIIQQQHHNRNSAAGFGEPGLEGDSWRYTRYLINPAIFFEMVENDIEGQPAYVRGDFLDNVRSLYELWILNTNSSRWYLNGVSPSVGKEAFASNRAVFFPCSSWELDSFINDFGLNPDNVTMIPMYMGIRNEEDYGCCCGDVRYWAVNRESSKNEIEATLKFLSYITGSAGSVLAQTRAMPFYGLYCSNPFLAGSNSYLEKGKKPVEFIIDYLPGEEWENNCFQWLIKFTTGYGDWVQYSDCFLTTWQDGYSQQNKYSW